jgi:hypothetical protein
MALKFGENHHHVHPILPSTLEIYRLLEIHISEALMSLSEGWAGGNLPSTVGSNR